MQINSMLVELNIGAFSDNMKCYTQVYVMNSFSVEKVT